MPLDPVKVSALKILDALRESALDGYRLLKKTNLTEDELAKATRQELSSIVNVQGSLSPGSIGEAYFSILPSSQGLAIQMTRLLSMMNE
jgi:hypothetical protein